MARKQQPAAPATTDYDIEILESLPRTDPCAQALRDAHDAAGRIGNENSRLRARVRELEELVAELREQLKRCGGAVVAAPQPAPSGWPGWLEPQWVVGAAAVLLLLAYMIGRYM